ncbi:hypothetical protein HYE07_03775 [Mycoplasmopsis bovis]|nr:hypothetical protein [Mycoplasmopsis bovis]QQH27421.1 hypothetical protein HYE07_03775 [Mycoplasmopsis bovis]
MLYKSESGTMAKGPVSFISQIKGPGAQSGCCVKLLVRVTENKRKFQRLNKCNY